MRPTLLAGLSLTLAVLAGSRAPAQQPAGPIATPAGGPSPVQAQSEPTATTTRPATWAQPIQKPGVPNLHKVTDNLYRSAQPSAEGMWSLRSMGIRTVVSLRSFHSDSALIQPTGLAYERIPVRAWHPEDEEVVQFLKIATDRNRWPILVHCQHGADRAGTMCAIYRVAVQGWTKDEAIREMTEGNFGFHGIWENLVRYIDRLDIERIRRLANIKTETTSLAQ